MTSRRKQNRADRPVTISVDWGYARHECPMAMRTWKRIVAGHSVYRREPYWYEGQRFTGEWHFNRNGFGKLRVTYDGSGVGFDGDLDAAHISVDGEDVAWADIVEAVTGVVKEIAPDIGPNDDKTVLH